MADLKKLQVHQKVLPSCSRVCGAMPALEGTRTCIHVSINDAHTAMCHWRVDKVHTSARSRSTSCDPRRILSSHARVWTRHQKSRGVHAQRGVPTRLCPPLAVSSDRSAVPQRLKAGMFHAICCSTSFWCDAVCCYVCTGAVDL